LIDSVNTLNEEHLRNRKIASQAPLVLPFRIDHADGTNLYVKDQAIVSMSLHHAKALMMILAAYITQYEKDNGKLAVPIPSALPVEHEEILAKIDSNA
jgi:hypothetical protein